MKAFEEIKSEIKNRKQADRISTIHKSNSRNDNISVAIAYLGRASENVLRNDAEGLDSREMLIKAAAVICEEIEK